MDPLIKSVYGNKVRVRVSGLCWEGSRLLMVNHRGITQGDFWAPPGGGLEFGESTAQCLKKEFLQETGLNIITGQFRFACEFIQKPLHAIELFFEVSVVGGVLQKGEDPELAIIEAVQFMTPDNIAKIPASYLHGIFRLIPTPGDIKTLTGFFTV